LSEGIGERAEEEERGGTRGWQKIGKGE